MDNSKRAPAPAPVVAQAPEQRRRGTASPEGGRAPVRNAGEKVDRRPLTAWEHYAQALLFTNELVYLN